MGSDTDRWAHDNALLQSVMNSTSDVFAFKDIAFRYRLVNDAACRFIGHDIDVIVGATDYDLFSEEIASQLRVDDTWVVENAEQMRRDEWYDGPAEGGTWLSATKSPVFDTDGTTIGVLIVARDITHRKSTEIRLRDALQRNDIAEEAGNIGTWELEFDSGELWCSDQLLRIFGYKPGTIRPNVDIGLSAVYPDDRERTAQALQHAIAGKSDYEIENRIVRPDNTLRWIRSTGKIVTDTDGRPTTLVGASLDITEQKEAEVRLQATFMDLELAQTIAEIGNWQFDPAIGVPTWSDEIYGIYERDPASGPPALEEYPNIYEKDQFELFRTVFEAALYEGIPYDITLRLKLPRDRVKWVHAIGRPEGQPGPKGFRIRGTIQDITRWKEIEDQLAREKEQFESVVKHVAAGLTVFDENQKISYVSPVYTQLFGYTAEEENGRGQAEITELIHPDDRKDLYEKIFSAIRAQQDSSVYEYRFLTKAGRYVWRRDRTRFLYDNVDNLYRSYVISTDITAEKAAAHQGVLRSVRDRVLGNCRSVLLGKSSEHELCEQYLDELARNLDYVGIWIGYKNNEPVKSIRPVAFRGLKKEYLDALRISWDADEPSSGPIGRSIKTGQPTVVDRNDTSFAPWRSIAEEQGIRAICSVPMKTSFDVFGVIVFDSSSSSDSCFDTDEIAFLERIGFDLAAGIADRRNRAEIERRNQIIQHERDNYHTVTELTGDIIVQMDTFGYITFANSGACEFYGIKREDLIGSSSEQYVAEEDLEATREYFRSISRDGTPVRGFSNRQKTSNGLREVLWNTQPLRASNGTIVGIQGTGRDVTEMKEREHKLEQLDRENKLLMHEINHRVKNNLAIVASLVRLKDEEVGTETDLTDIASQIEAVRIIHEKLYKSSDVTHVEMRSYILELLDTVFASYTYHYPSISASIEEITLPSKIAVSVGLITNEIATNAMKYGFSNCEYPSFTISFASPPGTAEYILEVGNSGDPIPAVVDLDNPTTLGLRLISALADQINGTVAMHREPHPKFTIRFPIPG